MSPGYPGEDYNYEEEAQRVLNPATKVQEDAQTKNIQRRAPGPGTNTLPPDYTPPQVPTQEAQGVQPPPIPPDPLNEGERQWVAQLEMGKSQAAKDLSSRAINPQEYAEHMAQLNAELQPLKARQAAADQNAEQQGIKKTMNLQAMATNMGLLDAAHKAKGFAQTVAKFVNHLGHTAYIGPDGKELKFEHDIKQQELDIERTQLAQKAVELGLPPDMLTTDAMKPPYPPRSQDLADVGGSSSGLEDLLYGTMQSGQQQPGQQLAALKQESAQTGEPIPLEKLAQSMGPRILNTAGQDITESQAKKFDQTRAMRRDEWGRPIPEPGTDEGDVRAAYATADRQVPQLPYNASPEQHMHRQAHVHSLALAQLQNMQHQRNTLTALKAQREEHQRREESRYAENRRLAQERRDLQNQKIAARKAGVEEKPMTRKDLLQHIDKHAAAVDKRYDEIVRENHRITEENKGLDKKDRKPLIEIPELMRTEEGRKQMGRANAFHSLQTAQHFLGLDTLGGIVKTTPPDTSKGFGDDEAAGMTPEQIEPSRAKNPTGDNAPPPTKNQGEGFGKDVTNAGDNALGNGPSKVTRDDVRSLARKGTEIWNEMGQAERAGNAGNTFGAMVDLLLHAHNKDRSLTADEKTLYDRYHKEVIDALNRENKPDTQNVYTLKSRREKIKKLIEQMEHFDLSKRE